MFDLLVREQELEVFKLFAGIRDLICTSVHPFSVLMLTTCLVVRKHTVAVFHCKDLVVNSTVVTVLVSEIVKLLTQLSDQLILLTASDLNTRALHVYLQYKIAAVVLTLFLDIGYNEQMS